METHVPSQAPKNSDNGLWAGVSLAWELGYIIAIPAAIFGYFGAWLDTKFDLSPLLMILGLIVAFVFSSLVILRKVRAISRAGAL